MIVTSASRNYINGYIDLSYGSGVHLFGHSPEFVINTIKSECVKSLTTQRETPNTLSLYKILKELTDYKNFLICNTGAEAVQKAVRMARNHKKLKKICVFQGSWHGMVDDTLEMYKDSISQHDTVFLERNLESLTKLDDSFCAVIVEPIPQTYPNFDDEFLITLSEVCDKNNIILISDEIISGFRLSYNFKSDIKIYGKAISGGLPISIIAYNNLAGFPKGGTFSGNNLSVSVCLRTLQEIKKQDFDYIDKLGDNLRKILTEYKVPHKGFGSMTRIFDFTDDMIYHLKSCNILFPKNNIIYNAFTEKQEQVNEYGVLIAKTYNKFIN